MRNMMFICLLLPLLLKSQDAPVFVSGQEGHKVYRIPAVIGLPNGNLLAFAEGRVQNSADFGDINLVMKKSMDQGKTWSALEILVDVDKLQAGNPAPVVDLFDPAYPNGVVYLFYNSGNNHENEIRKGRGIREVWFIRSFDMGITWTNPVNITSQVHRPFHLSYNFKEDWRSYANTPGHGFQFTEGKFKGRIFIAANHSQGEPQNEFRDYYAHGYYTDDHGKTFHISENIPLKGSNEAIGAALSGDRMLLNIRNQAGDIRNRIIAYSSDGGEKWDTVFFNNDLIDPVCQGSIIGIGEKRGKTVLAFSNPADVLKRDNLMVKISYDEGITWPKSMLVDKSSPGFKGDWSAYSDLVLLNKNTIGILYERNNYSEIIFKRVKIK
ncbi:MAG: glycoside hydrolase [Bacteroidetes bacterium]|nr:glycoside hydrolase [Bacteroidota bacterium]